MKSPISTISRYLYLNSYALLLLVGGVVVIFIPIGLSLIWSIIIKVIVCSILFKEAHTILSSWSDKKRKYTVLMTRNCEEFRPDTFKEYMQAPCGRLLVRVVLKDLNKTEEYKNLYKSYHQPLWKTIKENLKPQKTVVYINPNYVAPQKENEPTDKNQTEE